jgi:peptidoglycan/xylan/chitin deacetylase (PgdA/CDA1 family)
MLRSLPVLMYHSISRLRHKLCVGPETFEEHCAALAEAGWRGISLDEAEGYFLHRRRLPPRSLMFTFDDGYLDSRVHAEPILKRHGHCGVVFPVVGLVGQGEAAPLSEKERAALDSRPAVMRNGRSVGKIIMCSWQDLRAMRERGTMDCAPHSMTHGRVARDLTFVGLHRPGGPAGFFDVPPYEMPWGFPCFRMGHALASRAWTPAPELFDLVRGMVPQDPRQAAVFLKDERNRNAVTEAISKLPSLGTLETEEAYAERLTAEFSQCREQFRRHLDIDPVSFCWPWGDASPMALSLGRKAGFRCFFGTSRGANLRMRRCAIRRIPVRGGSGAELLKLVRFASVAIVEEVYSWAWNTF